MSLINRILYSFYARFENRKVLRLSKDSVIHPSAVLSGVRIEGKVQIAEGVKIANGVVIKSKSKVEIGRYTSISGPSTDIFAAVEDVKIGAFCSIARNVAIQEYNHPLDRISTFNVMKNIFGEDGADLKSKGPITIGNDVWIGTQCVILSGANIGDGAIIASNSVVVGEIPPYSIAAGSPAKVVKYRFDESIIDSLLSIRWWNWEMNRIKRNRDLFENPLTHDSLQEIKE